MGFFIQQLPTNFERSKKSRVISKVRLRTTTGYKITPRIRAVEHSTDTRRTDSIPRTAFLNSEDLKTELSPKSQHRIFDSCLDFLHNSYTVCKIWYQNTPQFKFDRNQSTHSFCRVLNRRQKPVKTSFFFLRSVDFKTDILAQNTILSLR